MRVVKTESVSQKTYRRRMKQFMKMDCLYFVCRKTAVTEMFTAFFYRGNVRVRHMIGF